MALIVKLDEDLSASVAAPFRSRGYDVRTVSGQGWGGLKDPVLWPMVVAEGALCVTADKGFGDLRLYPPGTHPGIVLLRPDKDSLQDFVELAERLLGRSKLEDLAGCLAVVTPRRIRVRRTSL